MSSEFYLPIFLEALHNASIVPGASDTTYFAMLAFGTYPMVVPFLIAVGGAALGQAFNWVLGRLIFRSWEKRKRHPSETQYAKAAGLFKRYGIWALLLCWMPLLNLIPIAAGFLGISFGTTLALVAAGSAYYYGIPLL